MQNKKEIYYKYLEENVIPQLTTFEIERKKTVRNLFLSSGIMFILGILFAFLFIYISMQNDLTLLVLPFFLFFMYLFFIKSIINIILKNREYKKDFTKNIFPYLFVPIANFKKWPLNNDTETVINSKLFQNFDTQEDVFSIFGIYKNTNIIISNTRLTLPIKGAIKGNLFKGTTIQLELPNSIDNHIILISKNEKIGNKLPQINLQKQELNKYLYTFAQNSKNLELINERLLGIIKNLSETYIAKGFKLSYKNNLVYIAIRQKNPMQFSSLFQSLENLKTYDEIINQLIIIFELIDYVNYKNN